MQKQVANYLKVGATGDYVWQDFRNGEPTRDKRGLFEIVEVRSNDFIIKTTAPDGAIKERVYCQIPKDKKSKKLDDGTFVEYEIEFYSNGFTQKETSTKGDYEYKFIRTMLFN